MIDVFIDESGNQGKNGKFFIIAAIVCSEPHSVPRIKRIFKKACLEYGGDAGPLKEIKGNELDFARRQELLNKIALRTDHEIFILTLEKKHVKTTQDNNQYYIYLSGLLIKQILKKYNDNIRITFDARDVKQTSLNSICDYLRIKADADWNFKHSLQVARRESHTVYCLQAADLIANTTYRSYTHGEKHFMGIIASRIEKKLELPIGKFSK